MEENKIFNYTYNIKNPDQTTTKIFYYINPDPNMSQFELLTMRINILEKLVKKEKLLNDLKSLINEHIQNGELNEDIKNQILANLIYE